MSKIKKFIIFIEKTCFTLLIIGALIYGGISGATFLGYLPDENYSSNSASVGTVSFSNNNQESLIEIDYNPELPEEFNDEEIKPENQKESNIKNDIKINKEENKNANYNFIAIGNSEDWKTPNGYNEILLQTLSQAEKMSPDFIVLTGDIISLSGQSLASIQSRVINLKTALDKYTTKFFLTFGFHDLACGKFCAQIWQRDYFGNENVDDNPQLYFSTDYENTLLIFLSTDFPDEKSIDEKQFKWLEETLSNTKKINKIVFMHLPPVNFFKESAKNCTDLSCNPQISKRLMDIFKKYQVDLIVSGQENAFDHKIASGMDIILSGNSTGNKPPYKNVIRGRIITQFIVENDKINLKAINLDKNEIVREIEIK